jgi:hypothetical protein
MMLRESVGTVGTLAHGAASRAVSVVRHPIGSAALAAGFAKGAARGAVDLVRHTITGSGPATTESTPRSDLPGADIVAAQVPDAGDLPEPVVIVDEPPSVDEPLSFEEPLPETGEAFHHEPHAASRDSEHGGQPGDREEVEGYVEEIPEEMTPHQMTGPATETPDESADEGPVLDSAAAKAVRSEAEMLQKGADRDKK